MTVTLAAPGTVVAYPDDREEDVIAFDGDGRPLVAGELEGGALRPAGADARRIIAPMPIIPAAPGWFAPSGPVVAWQLGGAPATVWVAVGGAVEPTEDLVWFGVEDPLAEYAD